jgi:Ca-activated chloride channel family protein
VAILGFLHDAEYRQSWYLLTCLAAVLPFIVLRFPSGRVLFSSTRLLPRGRTLRTHLLWLPSLALSLSIVYLGIALAGPRLPDSSREVHHDGIAIMMAVDISSSMSALDLSEGKTERTRLQAVQSVFEDFVLPSDKFEGRRDDVIGLVSFAGFADTRCPLTFDHEILVDIAKSLKIVDERREDGTAIGDGLGLALERLRQAKAKSKVVILLTDGVNNRGEETPMAAAKLAARLGIKVYTIGAGTNGLARIRAPDPFTGRTVLQQIEVEIDEETLKAIAEETGGKYFRATNADGLVEVYREIDKLERSKNATVRTPRYVEKYQRFVVIALLLALFAWALQFTILRRLP